MAHDAIRLSFKIDAYQPDTIPMSRLAEYMGDLATMLGEKADVHFVRLEDGCVQLVHDVTYTAYPKVEERTRAIRNGNAPVEAMNAYRSLNKRLALDNTFASYGEWNGSAAILEFPGSQAPKPLEVLPVEQPGTLVGVIQGVGGRSHYEKSVPVYIDAGDTVHTCAASVATAKALGQFVLGDARRFDGAATWAREESGAWVLKRFTILSHLPLESNKLSDVVSQLRAVPSGLSNLRDPWGALMADRDPEREPH